MKASLGAQCYPTIKSHLVPLGGSMALRVLKWRLDFPGEKIRVFVRSERVSQRPRFQL